MTADSSGGSTVKGEEVRKDKMERDELELQEDTEAERQDYFSENYRCCYILPLKNSLIYIVVSIFFRLLKFLSWKDLYTGLKLP